MRGTAMCSDLGDTAEGSKGLARLDAYLSSLPDGLFSHPECVAKGVLVRMLCSEQDYAAAGSRLAHPFRRMIEEPPMGSEWIPEVQYLGLMLALADACGQEDAVFLSRVRERCRRMFDSPAYRILMVGSSPIALLRGASLRWANWHRGSTLEIEGIADDGVRATLRFPRALFGSFHLRVVAEAFLAALDLSQAQSPRAEILEAGAGYAKLRLAWG